MPTMDILSIDKGPRKKKKEVIVQLYYYHWNTYNGHLMSNYIIIEISTMDILSIDKGVRKKKKASSNYIIIETWLLI